MKIFSLLFLLFVGAIQAQAQLNFTVDTTVDDAALTACTAAAGDCSLRGAVARANAAVTADTIDFVIPSYDVNWRAEKTGGDITSFGKFRQRKCRTSRVNCT